MGTNFQVGEITVLGVVDVPDAPPNTALETANSYEENDSNDIENVKLSKEADAIANMQTGETNFHVAIKNNNQESITRYLTIKHIPLVVDKAENTVYHTAAQSNRADVLSALFNNYSAGNFKPYPSHFELKNKAGNTSLHLAILGANLECILFLLEKGCAYKIPNNEGKTALDLVKAKPELLEKLLTSPIADAIKAALMSSTVQESRKKHTFPSGFFSMKKDDGGIQCQLENVNNIVDKCIKAGKIVRTNELLLERQSPEALTKFMQQDFTDEQISSPLWPTIIKTINEIVEDMMEAKNKMIP